MEITIASRFCGPPTSGNGGYTCGRLAAFFDGAVEVTLRVPPPLDTAMPVRQTPEAARLLHGGALVAEARPRDFSLDLPSPPSWNEAQEAARHYQGLRHHDYGTCFVCGPQRAPGDGLRLFCGPWKDGVVAGTWVPDKSLDDGHGRVRPEFLWAAIDCPGSWSVIGRQDVEAPVPPPPGPIVLGRLTGRLLRDIRVGQECLALGWFLGAEGRKYHVGSAVYTREGEPVAYSRGTWVALKS